MPVQIGSRPAPKDDAMGWLTDCHRRIETFLGALVLIAERLGAPLSPADRNGLETALRYFREAAPLHTEDEEASLFPRLRALAAPAAAGGPAAAEAAAVLERARELEAEHRRAETLHAAVERLGQRLLAGGNLPAAEAGEFRAAVAELRVVYARHIDVEDHAVFPAAARLIAAAEQTAMAGEMRRRRGR